MRRIVVVFAVLSTFGLTAIPALAGPPPPVCGDGIVEGDEQCDDGNNEPFDCCSSTCQLDSVGSACQDGNGCTQGDTCDGAGTCRPGTPVVCLPLSQCHSAGVCDPDTGACSNPPRPGGTACDDGDACTQLDRCNGGGSCVGLMPVVCEALSACHETGVCDPQTGICSTPPKPSGTPCSDGEVCTIPDTCDGAGMCVGNENICGDGIVQASCGEECDDGNTDPGDGCAPDCTFEPDFVCGDVTGDGFIRATDALKILRFAVGAEQPSGNEALAADVNASGGITATDALTVLKKAVGQPVPLDCVSPSGAAELSIRSVGDGAGEIEAAYVPSPSDPNGVQLVLSARANDDSRFDGWSCGACLEPDSEEPICTLPSEQVGEICAQFVLLGCPATPQVECTQAEHVRFDYDERRTGREKAKISWKRSSEALGAVDFGDPQNGRSAASVCIYDGTGALVQDLVVDRAAAVCGKRPCWSARGSSGYRYRDAASSADGVYKLNFTGGGAGKARADVQGRNRGASASLPLGVAATLRDETTATVQLRTSSGFCLGASLERSSSDGLRYRARR